MTQPSLMPATDVLAAKVLLDNLAQVIAMKAATDPGVMADVLADEAPDAVQAAFAAHLARKERVMRQQLRELGVEPPQEAPP